MKRMLFVVFILAVLAAGCMTPRGTPGTRGPSGDVDGVVFLGKLDGPVAHHAIVRIGDREVATDADGKFKLPSVPGGEHQVSVRVPMGEAKGTLTIRAGRPAEVPLFVIPWPQTNFKTSTFAQVACLHRSYCRTDLFGGGITAGSLRWPHGHEIRYFLDKGNDDEITNKQIQYAENAILQWVQGTNLEELGVLTVARVENRQDANFIVTWEKMEGEESHIFSSERGFPVYNNDGEITSHSIIINKHYMDELLPYYQAVGYALGLWFTDEDPNSVMFWLDHEDGWTDTEIRKHLNKTPTRSDYNYMNALYSLKSGTVVIPE